MKTREAAVRHGYRDESGQMGFLFILAFLVIFVFFALAFDSGLWYFDHRTAQNQADGAALAAAGQLPATSTAAAETAIQNSLTKNNVTCAPGCVQVATGSTPPTCPSTGDCVTVQFEDALFADGYYDQVTVALRRPSAVVFAGMSGIGGLRVSASATSLVGPAEVANVMPWAVVPPDPDCNAIGETCHADLNGDADFTDPGECEADFLTCPFGLNLDRIYSFKAGGGGNTGIIDACGSGASSYADCIEGQTVSGFYESGQTVVVGLQGGSLGINTDCNLKERYREEIGWVSGNPSPCHNSFDDEWAATPCDVRTSPTAVNGYDPEGRARALVTLGSNPPQPYCLNRLVLIPILRSMPPTGGGSTANQVIGVATFGIARWDHNSTHGMEALDADGDDSDGAADDCNPRPNAGIDPTMYDCGLVWGYLMANDVRPPEFLLQRIGTGTPNPLAPLLIALID